jgi:hypothetical protein
LAHKKKRKEKKKKPIFALARTFGVVIGDKVAHAHTNNAATNIVIAVTCGRASNFTHQ